MIYSWDNDHDKLTISRSTPLSNVGYIAQRGEFNLIYPGHLYDIISLAEHDGIFPENHLTSLKRQPAPGDADSSIENYVRFDERTQNWT